jgi:hypothetical protein
MRMLEGFESSAQHGNIPEKVIGIRSGWRLIVYADSPIF